MPQLQERFLDLVPLDSALKSFLSSVIADLNSVDSIREEVEGFLAEELDSNTIDRIFDELRRPATAPPITKQVATKKNEDPTPPSPPPSVVATPSPAKPFKQAKPRRVVKKAAKSEAPGAGPAVLNAASIASNSTSPVEIVAVSQQSRFHVDTLTTLSNDIDIKGVQLIINDRPLLVDASLKWFAGVKYALIGRNGVGKSTLLRVIGEGALIGFPKNVRVLYVAQLVDPNEGKTNAGVDRTVVDLVVDADRRVAGMKEELKGLQTAAESANGTDVALALRAALMGRLLAETQAMRELSIHRSGARGWSSRLTLVELEAKIAAMKEAHEIPPTTDEIEDAPRIVHEMIEEINENLRLLDSAAAEAKARKILRGLGFSREWMEGPISRLSGGWRIRVALAQALQVEPDVLLLDEPTNHLDLPAILWLQDYLNKLEGVTLVIVSHDRAFLNAVVEEVIVLKNKKLTYHTGNYDTFVENAEEKQKRDQRRQDALDRKKAHIEKSIQEGLRAAKKSGDDKKLGMVASRQRKLDDRFGLEVNAKGHRFKLNRDLEGYHLTHRAGVEHEKADSQCHWSIPDPEELRSHGSLLAVEDVSFTYPGGNVPVLEGVTLNIQMGERVGVVGANGGGKSTFAKLIMGEIAPSSGTVQHHPLSRPAFISQHLADSLPAKSTPLALMKERYPDEPEKLLRAHLGGFGIGALATDLVAGLSGGQRVRVSFALEVYGGRHLIILDEPTNHLDIDTIEAMQEALEEFTGAVLLISHDLHFLTAIAQRVYLAKDAKVTLLEGGAEEYVKLCKPK